MDGYYCQNPTCGNMISEQALKKSGRRNPPKYCSFACTVEVRKAEGFYDRFSRLGNTKQRELQNSNGEKPGRERRSQAMVEHNRLVPRRHSRGWHKKRRVGYVNISLPTGQSGG